MGYADPGTIGLGVGGVPWRPPARQGIRVELTDNARKRMAVMSGDGTWMHT